MAAVDALPIRLWLELNRTVHKIYSDTVQQAHGEAVDVESIANDIRDCIRITVDQLLCHASPQQDRLPSELWCAVWCELPIRDRLVVSDVSRRWRTIALGTRTLWQRIDVGKWLSRHHRLERLMEPILARSSPVALYFNVDQRSTVDVQRLATILSNLNPPHSHRLEGLTLYAQDPSYSAKFLGNFPELPALRSLCIASCTFSADLHWNWTEKDISLKCLQRLELSPNFSWPHSSSFQLTFPLLRTLKMTFSRTDPLQAVFTACPRLESLTMRFTHHSNIPRQPLPPELRRRLSLLRTATIVGCTSGQEEWICGELDGEWQGELVIDVDEDSHSAREGRWAFASITQLRGPVTLVLASRDDDRRAVVIASDQSGLCIRRVSFPTRASEALIDTLSHAVVHDIASLTVEASLWHAVRRAEHWAAPIRSLAIRGVTDLQALAGRTYRNFHGLRGVAICGAAVGLRLAIPTLCDFLSCLQSRATAGPLVTVSVQGITLEGQIDDLEMYALRVMYRA